MQKYQIINEVTAKEVMDITNRLEQAKKIYEKRCEDNRLKIKERQLQL